MKIGVFDSGIGGEAVAKELKLSFPKADIVTVNDKAHMPYGSREIEEVITLTDAAIQPLLRDGCDVVVLACNTATAAAVETLRRRYPDTPFVGLEPMLKSAASQTKTGIVAVCATPATLQSERYQALKHKYADSIIVLEPNCADWASMIEQNLIDRQVIKTIINDVCEQGADVITLSCTHYHWIEEEIRLYADNRAVVLQPTDAIARQVARVTGTAL